MHLFTYGTLMFPSIWQRVVGIDFAAQPATLRGYAVYRVRNDVYPVLVEGDPTTVAEGLVYYDLDSKTIAKLDRYESCIYIRQTIQATSTDDRLFECATYVLSPKHRSLCTDDPWTAEWFTQHALQEYMRRF